MAGLILIPLLACCAGAADDSLLGKPVVGQNADGHLDVFKIDADGQLRHRWQKESDGDWSSWSSLGGWLSPGFAIASAADGRMEAFAVDREKQTLQCIVQETPNRSSWSAWTNLGGAIRPPVAVAQDAEGRLEVFAVSASGGSAQHLRQTTPRGGWSEWKDLGGALQPALVSARNQDGRLEIFGVDAVKHTLVHCWQLRAGGLDDWSPWADLGGDVAPGFAAGQSASGRLEIFAVNRTRHSVDRICQKFPGSSPEWSPWHDFGGNVKPGLAVAQSADGRLELFAVDAANAALRHRFEISPPGSDNWSFWTNRGASALPYPAVGRNEEGNLELFVVDAKDGGTLKHRRQITGDWLDWLSMDHVTLRDNARIWQVDEGLPHNVVRAIAQTPDGYLWVGTPAGLARFDGMQFTVFDGKNTPEMTNSSITALCTDREGVLWIGTEGGGLVCLKDGRFTHFGKADGLAGNNLRVICEGRDGALWIGTTSGMSQYKNGQFATYTEKEGLLSEVVIYIYEDRDQDLWIATGGGLNRLRKNGLMDSFAMPNGLPNDSVRTICQDRGGRIWIGSNNGMLWYNWHESGHFIAYNYGLSSPRQDDWHESDRGHFYAYNTRYGLSDTFVSTICEDREGNFWVGTYSGLNRFREGRFFVELNNEGMPFDRVNALFEDQEGTLWVGSTEGLARLTPKYFSTLGKQHGLNHNDVTSVLEDRAGSLWIGTWGGGLDEWKDEMMTAYGTTNDLTRNLVLSTCESRDGSLWIGEDFDGGLSHLKDGKFTHYTWKDGLINAAVRVLHEDHSGNLWIGTSGGLSCLREGKFVNYTLHDPLAGNGIRAICEDARGNLWIGTDTGLSCWRDGQCTNFTAKDGLSDNAITALYEDKEQNLWIGTAAGGLNRYRNGRFTAYTAKQGLFSDEIFEILEDDQGWLWMSCSKGVFRVRKQELNDLDSGKVEALACSAYGKTDGMESIQCNGIGKPAGWKARDGRLWFPTSKGLVSVDPKTAEVNSQPPPVFIEQLFADKKAVQRPKPETRSDGALAPALGEEGTALEIAPGRGELDFRYTALDLQAPERIRFKYQLEGVDLEWVEAGGRREAHYNNVSPGKHRFHVAACNKDGIWNMTGASLAIVLQPHFWETWWFRSWAVLMVIGSASGVARFVVTRRMQRRLELLEQRHAIERERGRIAKDMHDDLGSSLTRIMMLGERTEEGLVRREDVGLHVRKIIASARNTVQSLDEIVWAVNPENDTLDGLVMYISHYADEFFENTSIRCRLEVPAKLPSVLLAAEVRHDLFLLVKEAFNNCLKHSRASVVRVCVSSQADSMTIMIDDNGRGFDSNGRGDGRKGNGLENMRKRMESLGGRFAMTSAPERGTQVAFTVPLNQKQVPS